jgi:hypothetical protein
MVDCCSTSYLNKKVFIMFPDSGSERAHDLDRLQKQRAFSLGTFASGPFAIPLKEKIRATAIIDRDHARAGRELRQPSSGCCRMLQVRPTKSR